MKMKNNSGFVLILSLLLLIFLGLLLEASSLRANIELQASMNRLASQQAYYAAESGLAAAINQLRINSNWLGTAASPPVMANVPVWINNTNPSNTLATALGFYTVEVKVNLSGFQNFNSVWVKSTGQSQQGVGTQITRAIVAQVVVENPTNFFLSTAGNLTVISGANIDSSIIGNNVNFVVNPSLSPPQNNINIQGTVYYLTSVTGNTNPAVTISPPTPTPPNYTQTALSPTETFSGVDIDAYRSLAQNGGDYNTGDVTYNGTISDANLNTSNGVVFSEGNIYISGTVQDSMIFVAAGNVYINGDVVVPNSSNGTPPQNDPNAPQLGLLAKGDVIIPSSDPTNLTIDAFLMADGGSGSQGGILNANASPLSQGTLNIMGAIAVRGNTTASAVNLNAYTTRNYTYNTQFLNNLKIPFIPAIAAIVSWEEVPYNCDFTLPIPAQTNQLPSTGACGNINLL